LSICRNIDFRHVLCHDAGSWRGKFLRLKKRGGAQRRPFLLVCLEQTHYFASLCIDIYLSKGGIGTGSRHQADCTSAGTQELGAGVD